MLLDLTARLKVSLQLSFPVQGVWRAGGPLLCALGKMAVLAEGDAQNREDLIYLEKLPLFHPDGTVME